LQKHIANEFNNAIPLRNAKPACACGPGFIAKTADCATRVTKGFIDFVDAQRGEVITYLISFD
jgi:hypothetical protein